MQIYFFVLIAAIRMRQQLTWLFQSYRTTLPLLLTSSVRDGPYGVQKSRLNLLLERVYNHSGQLTSPGYSPRM